MVIATAKIENARMNTSARAEAGTLALSGWHGAATLRSWKKSLRKLLSSPPGARVQESFGPDRVFRVHSDYLSVDQCPMILIGNLPPR